MKRITRAVVCAVPALVGPLFMAAPAFADGGASKPLQSAWFWYRPSDAFPLQPAPVTGPDTDPTTPDGGLPVSPNPDATTPATSERMLKESFISFDLGAVPSTATVNSFLVTAPVVGNYTQQSEVPKVVGCLPPRMWTAGAAQAWVNKPFVDCSTGKAPGVYDDAKKTWTFDLTLFAQGWVTGGNTGLALTNDPEYTGKPYQVVFDGPKITAEISWSPAVSVPQVPQVPHPQVAPPPMPNGGSTGVSSGSLGGGSTVVPPAAPVAQPQPQVAGQVTNQVALASVPLRVGGNAPGAGFWVLGLGIAALLALASWILGDTSAPVPARTGDSRLDRALRSRRLGGTSGIGASARSTRTVPLSVRPV
ncbi:MAG: hypothetical protein QOK42_775 [Frankiaceae bacterium]|jgi:hypothetical protein|nr:hypothetical protein [Frankiaceae bacterium]